MPTITPSITVKKNRNHTYNRLKKQVHLLLDPGNGGIILDKMVNSIIVTVILLNLLPMCLATVECLYQEYGLWFRNFELFSVLVFSVEYLLRVWSFTSKWKYPHPVRGRLRYVTSPGMLVDPAAVILAASLIYIVKHDAQPDKFSRIPETMWWSVPVLTTGGYGGILTSGFRKIQKERCCAVKCIPHCGKTI